MTSEVAGTAFVLLLALAAALCNAVSSVLQKKAAEQAPEDESLRLSLIVDLARRPAYLGGIGAMIASFLLQAASLSRGQLAVVQPVLATELLFLLGILVVGFHGDVGPRDWFAAAAIVVGVGTFLYVASPAGGQGSATPLAWALTAAAVVVALVVVLGAGHASTGSRRATLFGAAGAIAFALTAALVKVTVTTLTDQGLVALFTSWYPYAMGAAGAGAVFLTGNAFQQGSVAAAQAALSGIDPLVSVAIGVGLFGERLHDAPWEVVLEALGLLSMVVGVVVLSHSPLVGLATAPGPDEWERHPRR